MILGFTCSGRCYQAGQQACLRRHSRFSSCAIGQWSLAVILIGLLLELVLQDFRVLQLNLGLPVSLTKIRDFDKIITRTYKLSEVV